MNGRRTFLLAAQVLSAPSVLAHGPVGVFHQDVVVRALVARAVLVWDNVKQYKPGIKHQLAAIQVGIG